MKKASHDRGTLLLFHQEDFSVIVEGKIRLRKETCHGDYTADPADASDSAKNFDWGGGA